MFNFPQAQGVRPANGDSSRSPWDGIEISVVTSSQPSPSFRIFTVSSHEAEGQDVKEPNRRNRRHLRGARVDKTCRHVSSCHRSVLNQASSSLAPNAVFFTARRLYTHSHSRKQQG
jgi:hypothetical protein